MVPHRMMGMERATVCSCARGREREGGALGCLPALASAARSFEMSHEMWHGPGPFKDCAGQPGLAVATAPSAIPTVDVGSGLGHEWPEHVGLGHEWPEHVRKGINARGVSRRDALIMH